jgi:hypothetical protein
VAHLIADGEPHLALHDERFHGERVGVRVDDDLRRPFALDDLVEAFCALPSGEFLERELTHRDSVIVVGERACVSSDSRKRCP